MLILFFVLVCMFCVCVFCVSKTFAGEERQPEPPHQQPQELWQGSGEGRSRVGGMSPGRREAAQIGRRAGEEMMTPAREGGRGAPRWCVGGG